MGIFRKIGLDLGSWHVRVVDEAAGVVWDQPSCLAVQTGTGKVLAVGRDALQLQGRLAQDVSVIWPIERGVVAYKDELLALLKVVLKPWWQPALLVQPTLLVTVPHDSTDLERAATVSALQELGAREVILVSEPLAAMIGAGVPVADPTGSCFLHVGQGVATAGVVALGSIALAAHTFKAGEYLDWRLKQSLVFDHSLVVSEEELVAIKQRVVSFSDPTRQIEITAKDAQTQNPVKATITAKAVLPVAQAALTEVTTLLDQVFHAAPPELLSDSMQKGVLFSGGLAKLHGLDASISESMSLPLLRVDEPSQAAARGLQTIMVHLKEYRKSLGYQV